MAGRDTLSDHDNSKTNNSNSNTDSKNNNGSDNNNYKNTNVNNYKTTLITYFIFIYGRLDCDTILRS